MSGVTACSQLTPLPSVILFIEYLELNIYYPAPVLALSTLGQLDLTADQPPKRGEVDDGGPD
jgi:hypothetical protein